MHEIADLIPYEKNPVARVRQGGETVRRRLDVADVQLDFPVLNDIRAQGATDYFALPFGTAYGPIAYMASYSTDRPGGFSEREVAELSRVTERLSVVSDMYSQRQVAENVMKAYLGPLTGPRVLAGQIRRGTGEAIAAVLWSSDLRGFTRLSDRLSGEEVIAILDQVFDAQARAIASHGGEILKFIGDGLLAIFPIAAADDAAQAAANAMAAAKQALDAVHTLGGGSADEEPLKMVVALHYGTVIYGNIGAADRLDFTVIGPAVNLVSRIEAVAKSLNLPLIVSDDFARLYGGTLRSLGQHKLRGLEQPHELFAPTFTPRDPADAVGAGGRLQRALPQHVVHMRQDLAEGKAHLVGIERPRVHERYQLGRRFRRRPAGLYDTIAARLMMADQFRDARVQPVKRQIVPRKHQHIVGRSRLSAFKDRK